MHCHTVLTYLGMNIFRKFTELCQKKALLLKEWVISVRAESVDSACVVIDLNSHQQHYQLHPHNWTKLRSRSHSNPSEDVWADAFGFSCGIEYTDMTAGGNSVFKKIQSSRTWQTELHAAVVPRVKTIGCQKGDKRLLFSVVSGGWNWYMAVKSTL